MLKSPYDEAGFFSRLFFGWANVYVKNTSVRTELPKHLDPQVHYEILKANWEKELLRPSPSFFRALVVSFALKLCADTSGMVLDIFSQVTIGILVGFLIEYIQTGDSESNSGYFYAAGISLCLLLSIFVKHLSFLKGHLRSGAIKQAIHMMINDKTLKLSHTVVNAGGATGRIINLASVDVESMELVVLLSFLWLSPLAGIVVTIALLIVIGPAGVVGMLIISLLVPIQTRVNALNTKLRIAVSSKGDERVKGTTEIIEGIRVLKMYGWEEAYAQQIIALRGKEVAINRWRVSITASNMSLFLVGQGLACLATFAAYLLLSENISPRDIFSTLSLFITAQFYLTIIFPIATGLLSTYKGSCSRLTVFFQEQETKEDYIEYKHGAVKLHNVTASYENNGIGTEMSILNDCILSNASMSVKQGELCFIIGEVGSGKTSLLLSILGEINMITGQVRRTGRLSYAEQETWIVSDTLRGNIVLGRRFDEEKFNAILKCTGLSDDVN